MNYTPELLRKDAEACNGQAIHCTSGPALAIERRAHAAALERMAKLKRHAEAMAHSIMDADERMISTQEMADALDAYRKDFPANG